MEKNNCDSDENLTTDAHPSPLRVSDSEISETKDEEKKKPHVKNSSKPKRKKKLEDFSSATNTTVINIQGGSGIRIGHNYTYYVGNSTKDKSNVVKTVGIAKLLKRTDEVKEKDILFVSQYVGENWKAMAEILGFSEGEVYQFTQDMKDTSMKEVIYQILLDWIQNKPEEAQYGNLFTALWNAKERVAVKKMADHLETNQM